jgi:hypothetical protein
VLEAYPASLRAVKAVQILYREMCNAYRGVMLYPVLRSRWKIRLPDHAFRTERWGHDWKGFFETNARNSDRLPNFEAVKANKKGAIEGGIMTDGTSLSLNGRRPVKEQQRTGSERQRI